MKTQQFVVTPAAGKRLIATAIARHEAVVSALQGGTVVVVAGTTNGYVAEELLRATGQADGFSRQRFFRGLTTPPGIVRSASGRLAEGGRFAGDVVIVKGEWQRGQTLFEVAEQLRRGDVILKGANAVNLADREAAVLIGDPRGGTVAAALQAVVGRRVRLIVPVGLEKRVHRKVHELAALLNAPDAEGARLLPIPGEIVTEIEALALLAGVQAELVAAGGVGGAEGAAWLAVRGSTEQLAAARQLIDAVAAEPPFVL